MQNSNAIYCGVVLQDLPKFLKNSRAFLKVDLKINNN